jgi:glycosyltransferase involved in cell wall biosynthesis
LEGAVARATSRADHILADSESTKADLAELLEIQPQRITVLYPGVEDRFQPIRSPEVLKMVRERYGLPDRFVLGLSTIQPRKNFAGLLRGFQRLVQTRSNDPAVAGLQLVISGGEGWMVENSLAALDEPGLRNRVHLTGFVADKDLPALYSLAAAFAFPSWYEGFGLPVLEAMACGTPVVCADNSSLPEVAGQAALMVDAADTDALIAALYRVLTEADLRTEMASAGSEKAMEFKWSRAAEQLLTLYESWA